MDNLKRHEKAGVCNVDAVKVKQNTEIQNRYFCAFI